MTDYYKEYSRALAKMHDFLQKPIPSARFEVAGMASVFEEVYEKAIPLMVEKVKGKSGILSGDIPSNEVLDMAVKAGLIPGEEELLWREARLEMEQFQKDFKNTDLALTIIHHGRDSYYELFENFRRRIG